MMKITLLRRAAFAMALLGLLALPLHAHALPGGFPVSGSLQGVEGTSESPSVTFRLFGGADGGSALFAESMTLSLESGRFEAWIGAGGDADELFDGRALWLELEVEGEVLSPRMALGALPYAHHARSAQSAQEALRSEEADRALVASGLDTAGMEALAESALIADMLARIATLETQLGSALDEPEAVGARISELETLVTTQSQTIASLEDDLESANEVLQHFVAEGNDLIIEGVNVHIRSGAGPRTWDLFALRFEEYPESAQNVGNLIIGYAESEPTIVGTTWRRGTHNLIMGSGHRWNAHGAILSGDQHRIGTSGDSVMGSAAIGGVGNDVQGDSAVAAGGVGNDVQGDSAVAAGGVGNDVQGDSAVAAGGVGNDVVGQGAVAVGGERNEPIGAGSVSIGGLDNLATGSGAVLVGGRDNLASTARSVLVGGFDNRTEADAAEAVIAAGTNQTLTLIRRFLAPE